MMGEQYKPDVMLYHANCADGFGAAWAAWMRWRDEVEYLPVSYGQQPPDVAGKHVLIGDFSFKADVLREMGAVAKSIIVLDHHKTAEADLAAWARFTDRPERFTLPVVASMLDDLRRGDYPTICALFDMERSGARMVWEFCHDSDVPDLIKFIEDRDLWRFRFDETKPFGLWLRSQAFDFEQWELIAQELHDGNDAHIIMTEARAMQRMFDQQVVDIAALARWEHIGGYTVMACNCPPMFASEVGHYLLEKHPGTPFAACYSDQGNSRGYSLRSRDDRADVSEIARKFGGGGHRNAAGFGVPRV